jgi:putative SOS response-associated peptidase YedK
MTQQTDPAEVARIFDAEVAANEGFTPSWNVAPTDPVTVVVQTDQGRLVERHRWGLIPAWANSPSDGASRINARAETVLTSPAFRVAFRRRRCVVPADGFYEWIRDGSKRKPFLMTPADALVDEDQGSRLLAFAGLWSIWKDPATGIWVPSCSVVTTHASDQISPIHDRMPVILRGDTWRTWLDPDIREPGELLSLLEPAEDALAIVPVSPLVNSVRNNGPELIEPLDPQADGGRTAAERRTGVVQQTLFG